MQAMFIQAELSNNTILFLDIYKFKSIIFETISITGMSRTKKYRPYIRFSIQGTRPSNKCILLTQVVTMKT